MQAERRDEGKTKSHEHRHFRKPAGNPADRRRGRAREVDRQGDRHRGDGARAAEGRALALRRRARHPRHHRPEDRRDGAEARHDRGGRSRCSIPRRGPFNPSTDIMLNVAQKTDPEAVVGKEYDEGLPPIEFGRVAAQTAKQVINHEVREAERERQYDEYKDRVGEIINGVVKRVEFYNVIVDLGRAEGVIRKSEVDPAREPPHRRPHPRLHLRRAPRDQGPADLPVARQAGIHGPPVRAGSAGSLRRRDRDQGRRPRSGLARQDRRALPRQFDRPGRRLRRHARRARAGGGRRIAGREDRHHPVVARSGHLHRQRAAAGGSLQGRARSGRSARRSRGRRSRSFRSPSAAAARTCASLRSSPAGRSTS